MKDCFKIILFEFWEEHKGHRYFLFNLIWQYSFNSTHMRVNTGNNADIGKGKAILIFTQLPVRVTIEFMEIYSNEIEPPDFRGKKR